MNIKILGSGCPKCKKLEANTRNAISTLGTDATIEKVQDFQKIMQYGVMCTPAIVIDEKIVASGKVLSSKDIEELIKKNL